MIPSHTHWYTGQHPKITFSNREKKRLTSQNFWVGRNFIGKLSFKIVNIWNTLYHNYKLRKHTINTQITCCNGTSDSMENQNLETKKNLYVRQRFQVLLLKSRLSTQSICFYYIQGGSYPGWLKADDNELSVLGRGDVRNASFTQMGKEKRPAKYNEHS